MHPEYDYLFKILLIGDSGVGKSSLLLQFCDGVFSESYISTIGVDFKIKTIVIDGKTVKLQIWDTAGQERFQTITNSYYRGAHGIIIVYDVTEQQSFENIRKWLVQVEKHADATVTKLIVGNKSDLPRRVVTSENAKAFAESINVPCVEASAKKSDNVQQAFVQIATDIKKRVSPITMPSNTSSSAAKEANPARRIVPVSKPEKKSGGCCN